MNVHFGISHFLADQATEFPEELTSYGLTEENLLAALQQVGDGRSVDLKLTQTPTVRFYQSLHKLLKKKAFARFTNKTLIGKFYLEIDPFLRAKGGRADNIYRFVENMSKVPPDQPVNYRIELAQHKISTMRAEIEHCQEVVDRVSLEFGQLKEEFEQAKGKLQHTEKVLRDVTNQRDHLKKSRDFVKKNLTRTEAEHKSLEEEFAKLYMENIDLSDLESEEDGRETIVTKKGHSYVPEIRKLYYSLLADEIPATKVALIVRAVLRTFHPDVDVEKLPLPARSCASYMRKDELSTINNAHKVSVLSEASSFHLNTDGTTKNQKKLGGIVINDVVISVNEVCDGTASAAVDDISRELDVLRETAKALGIPNAESINWTLLVSSTSDSASTQKCLNRLVEERRQEDAQRFGVATAETIGIIENFCSMHLGVNLRKAFLSGMENQGTNDGGDTSRKYYQVDLFMNIISCLANTEYLNIHVEFSLS